MLLSPNSTQETI